MDVQLSSEKASSHTVIVTVPASVAYNLEKMQEVNAPVLGKLGGLAYYLDTTRLPYDTTRFACSYAVSMA